MSRKKVHFMGILANVDSSILKFPLEHGFTVGSMSSDQGLQRISRFERIPPRLVPEKLSRLECLNADEDRLYFISKDFEADIPITNQGMLMGFPSEVVEFDRRLIEGYLHPLIRLMRLFKEGNIRMPLRYYYTDGYMPQAFFAATGGFLVTPGQYTLETSEIPKLSAFIQETKLPFAQDYLQLAFENLEQSYGTHSLNLSFLSLMMSLESLFNAGEYEVGYQVCRNTAVVVGKNQSDSESVFDEIKKLYSKRCKIIHRGHSGTIAKEDLLRLRGHVRESIKEIRALGKEKTALLKLVTSSGFGDRPWRKQSAAGGRIT